MDEKLSYKEALIEVLAICRDVHPLFMGPHNQQIWCVIERLGKKDVHYKIGNPPNDLDALVKELYRRAGRC